MQQITFADIESLVGDTQQSGSSLRVTFVCPVTGESVESSASMPRNNGMGAMMRQTLIRQLMWQVRRWLRRFLGRGMQGRIASDMVRHSSRGVSQKFQYSQSDRRKATVEAFSRVQSQFQRDPQTGRWTHQSAAGHR